VADAPDEHVSRKRTAENTGGTLAQRNAEEVIHCSVNTEGVQVAPMRCTEAELTLAVIAARRGEVDRPTSWACGPRRTAAGAVTSCSWSSPS
jgi:hypothetical protein